MSKKQPRNFYTLKILFCFFWYAVSPSPAIPETFLQRFTTLSVSVCLFWPLCWRSPEGLEKTLVVPRNLQEFLKYATFRRKKACGGKSEEKAPTEEEQHMDKYSFQFLLCVSTNGHVTLLVPVIQSKQCFVEFTGKWACFWSMIYI